MRSASPRRRAANMPPAKPMAATTQHSTASPPRGVRMNQSSPAITKVKPNSRNTIFQRRSKRRNSCEFIKRSGAPVMLASVQRVLGLFAAGERAGEQELLVQRADHAVLRGEVEDELGPRFVDVVVPLVRVQFINPAVGNIDEAEAAPG